MGEYSTNTPLLSSTDTTHFDLEKKSSSFLKLSVKWVLKLLIWVVFISWISLMFFYPSKFVNDVFFNTWVTATKGTFFGLPGL